MLGVAKLARLRVKTLAMGPFVSLWPTSGPPFSGAGPIPLHYIHCRLLRNTRYLRFCIQEFLLLLVVLPELLLLLLHISVFIFGRV